MFITYWLMQSSVYSYRITYAFSFQKNNFSDGIIFLDIVRVFGQTIAWLLYSTVLKWFFLVVFLQNIIFRTGLNTLKNIKRTKKFEIQGIETLHFRILYAFLRHVSIRWFVQRVATIKILSNNFTHCMSFSEGVSKFDLDIMKLFHITF